MKNLIQFSAFLIILTACSSDDSIQANLNEFDAITERFPYTDLNPVAAYDYFELIYSFEEAENEELIFSEGTLCSNSSDPGSCVEKFENLTTNFGFVGGCLPSYCFIYIKLQQNETNAILNNREQLKSFLGTIDTRSEAILWANANDYSHSNTNKETGAIKEVGDHFELLVTKLVSACTPFQIDRVHLRIDADGTITELDREVYSYSENSCV